MVKIIENYTLHEQIGQGQYGKVYRAVDSRNKKEVAVKVINVKKFKQYPKLEQCTLNQIDILSKIDSPHIVKFIEILKTANNFYFFYEYCNEGTLQDRIKKNGRLQQSQAIEYFNQILQAFKVLSSKNIMHRDLKPSNILFGNGKIKLADFGFCKTLESERDLAQTMLGSPIYMAPEVLKGQIYTVKADIWSLGVVLYQMLFGFCPFEQRSIAKLINVLDNQQLAFNRQVNNISPKMEQLLKKMLVKDHFKRVGWQEIFSFIMNQDKRKNQLRQKSNFRNLTNYLDNKVDIKLPEKNCYNEMFNNKSQNQPPAVMFKKKSSKTQASNNYQDDSMEIWSNSHQKLVHYVKIVYQIVLYNFCPDLTIILALKLYSIIQKQHYKLPMTKQFCYQRQSLSQTMKIFQDAFIEKNEKISTGPLLNQYIKYLQSLYGSTLLSYQQPKELLIHCLHLLDLNQLSLIKSYKDYSNFSKEKLWIQLNQKIIKNTI